MNPSPKIQLSVLSSVSIFDMHHAFMHQRYMPHANLFCVNDAMMYCIMRTCILRSHIVCTSIIHTCIIDVEVEKKVLVNYVWMKRSERPKCAKDKVEGPHLEVGPGGPLDFL